MGKKLAEEIRVKYSGRSWNKWIRTISRQAEGTQRLYLEHFEKFINSLGTSPEGLYQMYLDEMKAPDPRDRGQMSELVLDFMAKVESEGYSKGYARQTAKAVRSFFKSSNVTLNLGKLEQIRSKSQKVAQHDEIRIFLENAPTLRTKAIIAILKDTGLRTSDMVNLKAEKVRTCIEAGKSFCFVQLQTRKEKVWANTMFGPDSLKIIKQYLEQRDREGIESEYLVCKMTRGNLGQMNRSAISGIFDSLQKKTGITGLSAHSLRRFHTTKLTADGLDSTWLKLIQGKSISEGDKNYLDVSEIPKLYKKHYSAIALYQSNGSMKGEVNGLKKDNVALMGTSLDQQNEIDELKARIAEFESGSGEETKQLKSQVDFLHKQLTENRESQEEKIRIAIMAQLAQQKKITEQTKREETENEKERLEKLKSLNGKTWGFKFFFDEESA